MPDLVTHLGVGYLLRRLVDHKGHYARSSVSKASFFLGTILPDITSRAVNIFFPKSMGWTLVFHTPAGAFLLIAWLTGFFSPSLRKRVFLNLLAGAGFHFFLDTFQKTSTGVFFWLFPISWRDCGVPLVDAGDLIPMIPFWLGLVVFWEGLGVWRPKKIEKSGFF